MGEVVKKDDSAPPAAVTTDTAAILSVLERAARDPNVDIDKMERLFSMQERMLARQAETDFAQAMADAQAEMEPVARKAKNQQTGSHYAKLEHIAAAIKPIYTRHGFSLSFGTADCPNEGERRITAVCRRGAFASHHHADIPFDNVGIQGKVNKTSTHAYKSTLTYGRNILTCLIFDVQTTDDDDGNAAGTARVTSDQIAQLVNAFDEHQTDVAGFCRYFRIDKYEDLPAKEFDRAMQAIKRSKKGGR